jgi:hypothetical protein
MLLVVLLAEEAVEHPILLEQLIRLKVAMVIMLLAQLVLPIKEKVATRFTKEIQQLRAQVVQVLLNFLYPQKIIRA